jgi:hypothetical protein
VGRKWLVASEDADPTSLLIAAKGIGPGLIRAWPIMWRFQSTDVNSVYTTYF